MFHILKKSQLKSLIVNLNFGIISYIKFIKEESKMRFRTKLVLIFGAVFVSMSYLPKMLAENNLATGSLSKVYLEKLNEMQIQKSKDWLNTNSIDYDSCKKLFEENKVLEKIYKECKENIDNAYLNYATKQ